MTVEGGRPAGSRARGGSPAARGAPRRLRDDAAGGGAALAASWTWVAPITSGRLFFTRTVRDGMALTLAGGVRPFAEVARAALRTTTQHTLSDEALDHVLAGFGELPPHPDVEPALRALARARIPAYAFTQGGAEAASDALDRAGLRTYLRGVLSAEEIRSFKPPARVYNWACQQVDRSGRPGGAGGRALLGRARGRAGRARGRLREQARGRGARRGGSPARGGRGSRAGGRPAHRPAGLTCRRASQAPTARCRRRRRRARRGRGRPARPRLAPAANPEPDSTLRRAAARRGKAAA